MKPKKRIITFILIVIVLVIAIGFTMFSKLDNKLKEVKAAKKFVTALQEKDVINTKVNLEEVEFKLMPKIENKNSKMKYTVVAENMGIDLDSKYNVTGFSQKEEIKNLDNLIDEKKAVELAEKYVSEITDEKFSFKKIKEAKEGEETSNTHSIIFYKYFKNYPYYDNEIVVSINKATGKLESYTNQNIKDVKHNVKRNIDINDAKKIAEDYFIKLDQKIEILEEPLLAVTLGTSDEFELSYVINVETTNNENKKDKYKLFINAESGEIVNVTTNLVKTSVSN